MSAKRPQKGSSKLQAFQDLKDDIWFHDIEVRRSYFQTSLPVGYKALSIYLNPGGTTGRNDAVINTGVEAPGQLVEEGSSTMRVKRIVDSSEILSQYHRGALYLEQDIRFLEHKLGCEMKELKELRKTFDDWDSRMKMFRMVSQCDSFTQMGSTDMPEQHPT